MTVMGPVKGLAVITFTKRAAKDPWEAGKDGRWPNGKGMMPHARLTRVATVGAEPVYRAVEHAQHEDGYVSAHFQAFAIVEADSEDDLRLVGEYIEPESGVKMLKFGADRCGRARA